MDKIKVIIITSFILLLFVSCERDNKEKYEVVFVYHNEQEVLILDKQYGHVVRVDIEDNTEEALKAREDNENTNTEDNVTEVTTAVVADSTSVVDSAVTETGTIKDAIAREKNRIKSPPLESKFKVGDWIKVVNMPDNKNNWLYSTDKRVFKLIRCYVFQDEIIWHVNGLGDASIVYSISEKDFKKWNGF